MRAASDGSFDLAAIMAEDDNQRRVGLVM